MKNKSMFNKDTPITESQQTEKTFLDSNISCLSEPKIQKDTSSDSDYSDVPEQNEENRDKWGRSHEFVFAVAGCAIGLGNVWRFPYLCYKYGGGSFVFAYAFFLFIVGVPMMLMEVTMGQFMSRGGIEAWNMVPIAKGIGFAALVVVIYINIYYIVILAWILNYFFLALKALFTGGTVPWSECDLSWASECCSTTYTSIVDEDTGLNKTILAKPLECDEKAVLPEAEYFSNVVLQVSSGIDDTQGMNWTLFGYLALAWVICFLMIFRGAKSTGKAAYFTSTFPLVILVALIVRGVTLEGASKGLYYYLVPDMGKLQKAETWMAAASQILFSYAICQGSLTSLGSYNKWSFNSMKWTLKLSLLNSCASLCAGVAIFSILGHLSHTMNLPITEVADKGPGLAFIAYPHALASLKGSAVWNCLFFVMLLMLGIASQCAEVEGMMTMMVDLRPTFFDNRFPRRRQIFVGISCLVCFVLALPMVLKSGIFYFQLMDSYGASGMSLMLIAICEVVAISWIFGVDNFYSGLHQMCYQARLQRGVGKKSNPDKGVWPVFKYLWRFVTPAALLFAMCYNMANISAPTYESVVTGKYEYPLKGSIIAIVLVVSSIIFIPAYVIFVLARKALLGETIAWRALTAPIYPASHPNNDAGRQIVTNRSVEHLSSSTLLDSNDGLLRP